jgi:hypothetical protein
MYSIIYDNQGNPIHTNSEQGRDLVKQYIRIAKGGTTTTPRLNTTIPTLDRRIVQREETVPTVDYFRSTVKNLTQHYFQLDYFFLTGFQHFQEMNVFRSRIMDEYKTVFMNNKENIPVLFIWKYTKPELDGIFSEQYHEQQLFRIKYYSYCLLQVNEAEFKYHILDIDSRQRNKSSILWIK